MRNIDVAPPPTDLAQTRAALQAGRDRITAASARRAATSPARVGTPARVDGMAWRTLSIGVRIGTLLATRAHPRRLALRAATMLFIRLLRRGLQATDGAGDATQENR